MNVKPPPPPGFETIIGPKLEFVLTTGNERTVMLNYHIDPWLPKGVLLGIYGRGESGKSTWVSTLCAQVSHQISTLWVTSEEEESNVSVRYTKTGGEPNTLAVIKAHPKLAGTNKFTVFNIYEHLESSILDMKDRCRDDRPLGVVVLDAVGALVTWGKGENANDDASVKKLLSYLHSLCERHDITIAIIGHVNKRTDTQHGADAVTGAAAWTTGPRRAFMFYRNRLADSDHEFFVRSAKASTGTHLACCYRTEVVHTIHERQNGYNEVLCRSVLTTDVVWGNRAVNELLNEGEEDDETKKKRTVKQSKKMVRLDLVHQAIKDGYQTREAVANVLKATVVLYPYHWTELDPELLDRGVEISRDSHNRFSYICAI